MYQKDILFTVKEFKKFLETLNSSVGGSNNYTINISNRDTKRNKLDFTLGVLSKLPPEKILHYRDFCKEVVIPTNYIRIYIIINFEDPKLSKLLNQILLKDSNKFTYCPISH